MLMRLVRLTPVVGDVRFPQQEPAQQTSMLLDLMVLKCKIGALMTQHPFFCTAIVHWVWR